MPETSLVAHVLHPNQYNFQESTFNIQWFALYKMKNASLLAILSIVTAISLNAAESESGPLTFSLPESATIEAREFGEGTIYSYTIVLDPADQSGLLMFSSIPGNTPFEAMKSMAETMRISFESEMRNNTKMKIENLASETSDFKAGIWEGYQTRITGNVGDTKFFQLMFTLWDGNQVWNGQFTGRESDYQRVIDIVKSSRRTSEQGAPVNPSPRHSQLSVMPRMQRITHRPRTHVRGH